MYYFDFWIQQNMLDTGTTAQNENCFIYIENKNKNNLKSLNNKEYNDNTMYLFLYKWIHW